MTTAYAKPIPTGYVDTARRTVITEGPAYVIGPRSTRWHRVRSVVAVERDGDRYESVSAWCGTSIPRNAVRWDAIEDDPRCGTCEGRWEGWRRERRLVFDPTVPTRPKWCPGSRALSYEKTVTWVTGSGGLCRVCGAPVSLRSWGYDESRVVTHAPGPKLPDPCLLHGYLALRVTDEGAQCACGWA